MFSDAIEAAVASPTQPCLIQFQLVQDIHNQPACIYFHRRSGYGRGGGVIGGPRFLFLLQIHFLITPSETSPTPN